MRTSSLPTSAPSDSSNLDDLVVNPTTYAHPDRCDALFARLRREDPVHWTQPDGHRPFWCVTKYADIQDVEMRSDIFINAPRLVLREIQQEEKVKAVTGGRSLLLRNLINMDGPEHYAFRQLTQAWFMPPRLKALEADLRELAREYVRRMIAMGDRCDFVQDVASWYPLRVIMRILGVPAADDATMLKLTQQNFGSDDPEVAKDPNANLISTIEDFFNYFRKITADRRANPQDDIATLLSTAKINGAPVGDQEILSYFVIIATAGHDTTSSTIAGGLLALLQNPDQMARLRADPAQLPAAIDEMFRWVTPVKHFFRTATVDARVGDRAIKASDSLLMCYPSANRDEDVFEDPFSFRIDRKPNRHIAFGYGPHVCLGQHLAKLEIRVFFEELFARTTDIELAGDPAWVASNFVSGLKRLPIRLVAA
jgi:cytochrome P450